MKPTLVDNCEHYNFKSHVCDKCGRGLPDVCLEFEEMRKKASSFDTMQASSEQPQLVKPEPSSITKARGRQKQEPRSIRKPVDGENTTD